MTQSKFDLSLQSEGHRNLAAMAGEWQGNTQVWFDPDASPAMEVVQHGAIRSILGGRFLSHEYAYGSGEEAGEGFALYGVHLDTNNFESAWVDSFHTGSAIMFSTAEANSEIFQVLGSYGDGQGGPRWGWRTRLSQPDENRLIITMFNIAPDGKEAKAVETQYIRKSD